MNTQPNTTTPVINVPRNTALANEPSLTIGENHVSREDLRLVLAAIVGLLAAGGIKLAPDVPANLETIVVTLVPVLFAFYARFRVAANARDQAAETRSAVFSPASTARLVSQAKANPRGAPEVVTPPGDV